MAIVGSPVQRGAASNPQGVFMKTFKQAIKYGAGAALLAGGVVHAEVPAAITTAISTMQTDGVTVATAFVVAAIAVAAIKFLRSAK
jgi:hypothetical protein